MILIVKGSCRILAEYWTVKIEFLNLNHLISSFKIPIFQTLLKNSQMSKKSFHEKKWKQDTSTKQQEIDHELTLIFFSIVLSPTRYRVGFICKMIITICARLRFKPPKGLRPVLPTSQFLHARPINSVLAMNLLREKQNRAVKITLLKVVVELS